MSRDPVTRVVAALNAHDLEAFVASYAPDATIEDGYDRVAVRGQGELRARYAEMFELYPSLYVEPSSRIEVGEFVVQEEAVAGRAGHERHVAVYLVRDGVIVRERLLA